MAIVNGIALESNKNLRINFEAGTLFSDAGLLLLKEFYYKLGMDSLVKTKFHTTDSDHTRSIKIMKICRRCFTKSRQHTFRTTMQIL